MLVLGIDLECTSLDPKTGKILEVGYVLKKIGESRPWLLRSEFCYSKSWGADFVPEEARLINGIHPQLCISFGRPLSSIAAEINSLAALHRVDAIVGHNIKAFDMPYLLHHIQDMSTDHWETLKALPVIDTMTDIEYPAQIKTRTLSHLCADHGFLNTNAHTALADVLATLRLLECYDVKETFARSKEPRAIYRAFVEYDQRDKAKALGFRWENINGRTFPKCWVKELRDAELEGHIAKLGLPIRKLA